MVKILAIHPHTTVEHAPLSSSQGNAGGGGLAGSSALSPRSHLQKQPLPSASSPPFADSMFSAAAVDDNHVVVLQEELLQVLPLSRFTCSVSLCECTQFLFSLAGVCDVCVCVSCRVSCVSCRVSCVSCGYVVSPSEGYAAILLAVRSR